VEELVHSRHEIYSIKEDCTVHDAARSLRDHEVRSVGVISHRDISDKVAAENKCPAWMHISEIMTRALVIVRPEKSLDECLCLIDEHGVFHLLVVDEQGEYYGMISVTDLLQVIASDHKTRADMFEAFLIPQR
jgi:CBS domain-containing protein